MEQYSNLMFNHKNQNHKHSQGDLDIIRDQI